MGATLTRRVFLRQTTADIGAPTINGGADCLYDNANPAGDGNTSYVSYSQLIGAARTISTAQTQAIPAGTELVGITMSVVGRSTGLLPNTVRALISADGTNPVIVEVIPEATSGYNTQTVDVPVTSGVADGNTFAQAQGETVQLGLSNLVAAAVRITTVYFDLTYRYPDQPERIVGGGHQRTTVSRGAGSPGRTVGGGSQRTATSRTNGSTAVTAAGARQTTSATATRPTGPQTHGGGLQRTTIAGERQARAGTSGSALQVTVARAIRDKQAALVGGALQVVTATSTRPASTGQTGGGSQAVTVLATRGPVSAQAGGGYLRSTAVRTERITRATSSGGGAQALAALPTSTSSTAVLGGALQTTTASSHRRTTTATTGGGQPTGTTTRTSLTRTATLLGPAWAGDTSRQHRKSSTTTGHGLLVAVLLRIYRRTGTAQVASREGRTEPARGAYGSTGTRRTGNAGVRAQGGTTTSPPLGRAETEGP